MLVEHLKEHRNLNAHQLNKDESEKQPGVVVEKKTIVGIEEQQSSTLMNDKYYDLMGREIEDITTYPIHSLYINRGKKYIKIK